MLFKNIKQISSDKTEKKFFVEKINIINELVEKYSFPLIVPFNVMIPLLKN